MNIFWTNRLDTDFVNGQATAGEMIVKGMEVPNLSWLKVFREDYPVGSEEAGYSIDLTVTYGFKVSLCAHKNLGPDRPTVIIRPCGGDSIYWLVSPAGVHQQDEWSCYPGYGTTFYTDEAEMKWEHYHVLRLTEVVKEMLESAAYADLMNEKCGNLI